MGKKIIAILAVLFAVWPAFAQRTVNRQYLLDIAGNWPCGASVSVGQYQNFGYWEAAAALNNKYAELSTGEPVTYAHIQGRGGYMFRLAGSYTRALNLYAGAGAVLGCELTDPYSMIPDNKVTSIEKPCGLVYGLYPKAVLEVFPFRTVALVASFQAPVVFGSQFDKLLYPEAGLGLRFML